MNESAGRTGRPQKKDRLFPKFASDYFAQLRQQYTLMLDQTGAQPPPTIERLFADVDRNPGDVTWADVFALESAYLYAVPDDRLAAQLLYARERYQQVVGEAAYASYAASAAADVTQLTLAQRRAELLTLAERVRYLYTFVPPKESIRNRLSFSAAVSTLAAALVGIVVAYLAMERRGFDIWTVLVVVFAGQMGGFLSVQQRLQSTSETADPLFKELQLSAGEFSVAVIAPISGAVFAVVLYLLFVAGLLSGGLFPQFGPQGPSNVLVVTPPHYHDVTEFLDKASPTTMVDWGKLLVWAFIAGFAERFVPDVLNRLTAAQFTFGQRAPAAVPAPPTNPHPVDLSPVQPSQHEQPVEPARDE